MKVEPTSLEALVSPTALRQSLGLSEVVGDVVIQAPASRIVDSPLLGMAVSHDDGKLVAAHRVLLLVRGTEEHSATRSAATGRCRNRPSK